jgi:S1-C subfamily serine protease
VNASLLLSALLSVSNLLVPGIPGTGLSLEQRWQLLEATPRLVGSGGTATAVVVGRVNDDLYLLTSEHVVRNSSDLKLEFFDRTSWPKVARTVPFGITLETFPVPDLAVVKFPMLKGQTHPAARLATRETRPKRFPADGLSIGCTNGKPPTVEDTVIGAKRLTRRATNDEIAFFWETEQVPVPGRSGGPLFDASGRLIGICAATTSGKGFYTHLDEIQAALKQRKLGWLLEANPPEPTPR